MRSGNGCDLLKSSPTYRQAVSLWRTLGQAGRMVKARSFIHSKRTSSWQPIATIKPATQENHRLRKTSRINNRANSRAASNQVANNRAPRVEHMSSTSKLAVKATRTIWTKARLRSNRARKALASSRVRVAVPAPAQVRAQVLVQARAAARPNSMRKQAVKATRMTTSRN